MKRNSKAYLYILIVVTGLILAGISIVFLRLSVFEGQVAELRRQGMPVQFEDLVVNSEDSDSSLDTRELLMSLDFVRESLEPRLFGLSEDPMHQPPTPEVLAEHKRFIAEHPSFFLELQRAARAPVYKPDFSFNQAIQTVQAMDVGESNRLRSAVRILLWHANIQAEQGNWKESIDSCLDALALSEDALENPGIIPGLLSLALQDMAVASLHMIGERDCDQEIAKDQWDRVSRWLEKLQKMEGYRKALISERVSSIESIRRSSVFMKYTARDYLDFMKDQIDNADINSEFSMVDGGSWVIKNAVPALKAFHEKQRRTCVLLRAMRIYIALKQRSDASTDELQTQGLAPEILQDPFSGKPLIIKRTDSSVLIYSVGLNRVDDQGDLSGPDIGLESATSEKN